MIETAYNPLIAWSQATPESRAAAQAADAEKERRVDAAVAQTIVNASQAVALLQARGDHDRLLRLSNALNEIVARALGAIPDDDRP